MRRLFEYVSNLNALQTALIAGLLLVLGWSPLPTFFLLFIGVFMLLVLENKLENKSRLQFFCYFYLAHLLWNVGTTWWVYKASLGGAIFMLIANSAIQILPWALYRFSKKVVGSKNAIPLFFCYYIGFEHFHQLWDLSWPWLTLGNSLGSSPAFAQFYQFTGVAGGSLWILIVGFSLYSAYAGKSLLKPLIWAIVPAVLSLGMFFFQDFEEENPIKVGLIQPNYEPHFQKFEIDPLLQVDTIIMQMEDMAQQGAELMVLPETALVDGIDEEYADEDRKILALKAFIKKYPNVSIIGGCDTYRLYEEKATTTARKSKYDANLYYDVYNTAFYLDSLGLRKRLYHKAKLVPGTEIMPYPGFFSFLDKVMISLDGTPNSLGRDFETFNYYNSDSVAIAPNICYESIYGDWTSDFTRKGANIIAIMSNDGWWGQTYGYQQLLDYGKLRAIENRRWIARSGNTGISGVISPKGIMENPSTFWKREAVLATVYPRTKMTMYAKLGDFINRTLFLVCLFVFPSICIKWFVSRKAGTTK
jgi:apolipoprotein N-acyltransferase